MTALLLNDKKTTKGIEVRSGNSVVVMKVPRGQDFLDISVQDFMAAAAYVLTNSDLVADDQRREFVKIVKALEEVPVGGNGATRFKIRE